MKNLKKVLTTTAVASAILFSSYSVSASYETVIKQFDNIKTSGTFINSASFSGGLGKGTLAIHNNISVDSQTKKLGMPSMTLKHTVATGNPYYTHIYVEDRVKPIARYEFEPGSKDKFLKNSSQIGWGPNTKDTIASTVYIMTDASSAGTSTGKQYRYHSIFK